MINVIRNVEKSLGSGIKKPSKSETKNIEIARKSIAAKRDIKKGEIFSEDNITIRLFLQICGKAECQIVIRE